MVVLLAVGYLAFASLRAAQTYGYGVADMDWNGDGSTSLGEFFASADIGSRPRGECREFFSLKDGLPVREDCPEP